MSFDNVDLEGIIVLAGRKELERRIK